MPSSRAVSCGDVTGKQAEHARKRGLRPCGHETETNAQGSRPARPNTSRFARRFIASSPRVQDSGATLACYGSGVMRSSIEESQSPAFRR
jgi:hypothetical protein